MDNQEYNKMLESTISRLDWTIDNVLKRGYDDYEEDIEDYSKSIEKYEIRKMITFELYENYFTPKRHEFELQIIVEIVDAVVKYQSLLAFIGGAAISGVIGSSVYDLLKNIISHISGKFSTKDKKRDEIFLTLKSDITLLEKYFENNDAAKIEELEDKLKIERERLVPLLKLLGFKRYKRKNKKIWVKP